MKSLENLLEAVRHYDLCKEARDTAMSPSNFSMGYHASDFFTLIAEAETALADALNALIDERIDAKLKAFGLVKFTDPID